MRVADHSIETGETGWISSHRNNRDEHLIEAENRGKCDSAKTNLERKALAPEVGRLFAFAERSPVPLPERYPRLTFAAIALVLLISSLTAEFEYLRGAGYFWQ